MGAQGASSGNERVRVPAPILRRRVPSGRGATEQPNHPVEEAARLTPRFWAIVVVTGVAAGLTGAALMALLNLVQHVAFGYSAGSFEDGARQASSLRRILATAGGGVLASVGWFLLRRWTPGRRAEVDETLWNGDGVLSFPRSAGTSVLSEIAVGAGASVGREAAPKLMGGVVGSVLASWTGMTEAQRKLLVACGAGAGFSAVYNLPLGGAVFTAEVLCGSVALPVILPALAASAIATATSWAYLPPGVTYPGLPDYPFTASALIWGIVAGLPIGLLAAGFVRLVAVVSHHRPRGWRALPAPLGAMLVVGAVGLAHPELFGNGKIVAHLAFTGQGDVLLFLALALLKPALTSLCLGSGISGGLFTPTMSTGAAFGAGLGLLWTMFWPGTPVGAFALIGAAAMIGAAMQAPLAGLALVLDLTHVGFGLMVPMALATIIATLVARHLDGYSIYSARLPAVDR